MPKIAALSLSTRHLHCPPALCTCTVHLHCAPALCPCLCTCTALHPAPALCTCTLLSLQLFRRRLDVDDRVRDLRKRVAQAVLDDVRQPMRLVERRIPMEPYVEVEKDMVRRSP